MDRKALLRNKIYDELATPFYLIKNPFKTFEKIKEKHLGNIYMAIVMLFLLALTNIIKFQYTGFILNVYNQNKLNSLVVLATTILPILVFVFANLGLTTFFDGKGHLNEIFKVTTYSLFPYLVCKVGAIMLSNFIVLPEQSFVTTLYVFGIIHSSIMLFIGLVVIHEYGMFKNIFSLLFTFVAMCVIIFVILLFFNLIQQLLGFGQSFISEVIYRIRGY